MKSSIFDDNKVQRGYTVYNCLVTKLVSKETKHCSQNISKARALSIAIHCLSECYKKKQCLESRDFRIITWQD